MIIGYGLNIVNVERKSVTAGKIEVKYNLAMENIEEEKMDSLAPGQIALRMEFKYAIEYSPKLGNISLQGSVLYLTKESQGKAMLSRWKKEKKLGDEKVAASIFNHVLTRCNIKALSLAQEVGLPPHIPLPRAIPKDAAKTYIG